MRRSTLAWLFLAALAVNVAFLLLEPRARTIGDEGLWRSLAREMVAAGFSPLRSSLITHPPLYPYFLAGGVQLLGTFQSVKWLQVIAGALLAPAVASVGARVASPRVGLLAGAIAAVYPELVWHSTHFWSEVLLLPLLWWSFDRLLAADERGRWTAAAQAGLLWGLATLTRETVLYFAPLVALWLAWRRPPAWRTAAAFLVAWVLVLAPWTWRNHAVFGSFVPVATRGSTMLLLGNTDRPWHEVSAERSKVDPVTGQRDALAQALREATSHPPGWYPRKVAREMAALWGVNNLSVIHLQYEAYGRLSPWTNRLATLASVVPYLALVALAALGLAATRLDRPRVLLFGFFAGYALLHAVAFGFPRFRLPLLPVLFLLAAEAVLRLREGPPLGRRRLALAAAIGLVAALVLAPSLAATWREPIYAPRAADEAGQP